MHPLTNTKHLVTVAVLSLSMTGFAAEPKLSDFPLRGEVSTASRTRSDGNTWTTFKIDRSSVVTGGDFGAGIYAVSIKGKTHGQPKYTQTQIAFLCRFQPLLHLWGTQTCFQFQGVPDYTNKLQWTYLNNDGPTHIKDYPYKKN